MPITLSLDLFDKLIVPILLYGSQIWGTIPNDTIEKIQRKFYKHILKVPMQTSNEAVLGELGKFPLSVLFHYYCIKYWLIIVQDESCRLRKSLYKVLKEYDEVGKITWATNVKNLLYTTGFGEAWLQQGVGNAECFLNLYKQRLKDITMQNWQMKLNENKKLSVYSKVKTIIEMEKYLTHDIFPKHKHALTRFRCSAHKLAVERLRPTHTRDQRLCIYCKKQGTETVEDEYNFLLVCPLYSDERSIYIKKYYKIPSQEIFVKLIASSELQIQQNVAAYIYSAFCKHEQYTFDVHNV